MARRAGAAHVSAVDPVASRRDLALELGADDVFDPPAAVALKRSADGADVAVETSGNTAGLHDAIAAARLGGTVVTVGFYQGGAAEVRLGEEWHHNRLDMVSSMGAWGAPHRAHPAWDRPRVMRTVVDLLASGALRVDGLPVRHFPFEQAVEAYGWLDANPNEAVKVALTYDGFHPAAGGEQ
jgi:threonine dehydrogenase-like Zn-dependent dehydrogenase